MVEDDDPKPSGDGLLPSPYVGVWRPLELYEPAFSPSPTSAAHEQGSSPETPLGLEPSSSSTTVVTTTAPPNEPPLLPPRPVGTPNEEIAHRLTQMCLEREPSTDLLELLDLAGTHVPTLRLLHAMGGETEARVGRQLLQLGFGEFVAQPDVRRFESAPNLPSLTDGNDVLVRWRDGLSAFERAIVTAMRTVAPADGDQVPLSTIAQALRVDAAKVGRALASLGNPRLRPLPIAQVTGLTVDTVSTARLSDWAEEMLSGELPLPLLLINGAPGKGRASPTWNIIQVLDAGIALVSGGPEVELLPDFPTGGVLDSRTLGALGNGHRATIRLLARVKQHYDPSTGRSRLIVDEIPWPLTAREVTARLHGLVTDGAIEGARSITSTSSAVVMEFAHIAWARRAARELSFVSLGKTLGPLQVTYEAQLLAGWPVSPLEYLERFLADYGEPSLVEVPEAPVARSSELVNAEALAVALALLDEVKAALRPTIDLDEEVQALMTFMTSMPWRARDRLIPLGRLTHSYDRGFTEAQARWLASGKRLTSRSAEFARRDFQRLRDEDPVGKTPLRASTQRRPVRLELERAKQRFARPRRTTIDRLPDA